MSAVTRILHAGAQRYRARVDRRWRRLPDIHVLPAAGSPTVHYLVPHAAKPHGGVRMAYRHVDQLNGLGVSAAVLHARDGFHPDWFGSSTRVESTRTLRFRENDILVVPEVYGPAMRDVNPGVRVLVFNQGGYITFDALDYGGSRSGSPYRDLARFEGIMTVSEDSAELLALSFPEAPIAIARPVIDATVFHPGAGQKRHGIAYVPTRRPAERHQLLHVLRSRGLAGELRPLIGLSEVQMADELRSAAVFLSLSDRDGFGLPPAEAMACGAYVVGYHGGGGREFFDPDYCSPVSSTIELVSELERAVSTPAHELAEAGLRASAAVRSRYTLAGLREDLAAVYGRLIP
ncbi:glycosyltransferase [Microbacterium caowuchunii]|uniref:glycosyltransferase n=1 Tax=Microbacterium caowuchunii TaxID=2614638 RepID=UPI0012443FFE|nr:glycosyltransferase [Microbacterium caowuchunii]QEW00809.1 glycosyltransferase [Microbacterium caowuchunii]